MKNKKTIKLTEKNKISNISLNHFENHEKIVWKPGTMLYPLPVVMVSCGKFGFSVEKIRKKY